MRTNKKSSKLFLFSQIKHTIIERKVYTMENKKLETVSKVTGSAVGLATGIAAEACMYNVIKNNIDTTNSKKVDRVLINVGAGVVATAVGIAVGNLLENTVKEVFETVEQTNQQLKNLNEEDILRRYAETL